MSNSGPIPDRWPLSAFGDEVAPDLEDQVAALCAQRIAHVELRSAWGVNVVDLGPRQLDRAAAILRDAGVGVSAIGSPVGKAPVEGDFEEERDRFRAALDAAGRLGTPLIRVFSFFIPDGRYAEFRDEVLRRMSAMAADAEARGLTLVHENESYIYGDTAERCRDLVESVGSPALRLAFDPANFVQVDVRPVADAWPLLAAHVAHVHIKDAVAIEREGLPPYPAAVPGERLMRSVRLPGKGEGQLPDLLRALDGAGYRGFLTIEPHLAHRLPDLDGAARLAAAASALRELLAGL